MASKNGQISGAFSSFDSLPNSRQDVTAKFQSLVDKLKSKEQSILTEIGRQENSNQVQTVEEEINIVWNTKHLDEAIDSVCKVVNCDSNQTRLAKSNVVWKGGPHGPHKSQLCCPKSFTLCHATGKLYVADTDNKRISCFKTTGQAIRFKSLTDFETPFPELIVFNQHTEMIWVYATDSAQKSNFIAIYANDFTVKHTVPGHPKVRSLSIDPVSQILEFYSYNSSYNCITFGEVDPLVKPHFLRQISLESEYLEDSSLDVEIARLDDYIFVLYQDCPHYRIIKFDLKGTQIDCYLPRSNFGKIQCFSVISQDMFLLGRIADVPFNHEPQSSMMSPLKQEMGLQICMVTSDGRIRGQVYHHVQPAGQFNTNDLKCSQLIFHEGQLYSLLSCCDNNLIAF